MTGYTASDDYTITYNPITYNKTTTASNCLVYDNNTTSGYLGEDGKTFVTMDWGQNTWRDWGSGSTKYRATITSSSNIETYKTCYIRKDSTGMAWYGPTDPAPYLYAEGYTPLQSPQQRLQEIIRSRQAPAIRTRNPLGPVDDVRELRARQTLRRVIGEKQYRAYLRFGFVSVRARSGLVYQLPGNNGHIVNVYKDGQHIEKLCVYLQGQFPPTDQIITEYLMVLNNEQEFRSLARISKASKQLYIERPDRIDTRPLSEIFRELKGAA